MGILQPLVPIHAQGADAAYLCPCVSKKSTPASTGMDSQKIMLVAGLEPARD